MNKTIHVRLLSETKQDEIKQDLIQAGLTEDDLENALNSRLCDLENIISIQNYLKM